MGQKAQMYVIELWIATNNDLLMQSSIIGDHSFLQFIFCGVETRAHQRNHQTQLFYSVH